MAATSATSLRSFGARSLPPDQRTDRASDWTADQIYMGHFALTDVAGQDYQAFEHFARGGAGLAGAQADPYHVWLEDWQVEEVSPGVTRSASDRGRRRHRPDADRSQGASVAWR